MNRQRVIIDEMTLLTLVRWAGAPLLLVFITEVAQLLLKVRAFPCSVHSALSFTCSSEGLLTRWSEGNVYVTMQV